jgi:uncharacterized protein with HEPN domain
MSDLRIVDYLGHIVEAIDLAASYVKDLSKAEFEADIRTQQAASLNIIILGEAAAKLITEAPEWVAQHDQVPWKVMRAMRNRITHGYFDINLDVVWNTITQDLVELRPHIVALRDNLQPDLK